MHPMKSKAATPVLEDMGNTDTYILSFFWTKRKKADSEKVEIRPKKTNSHYSRQHHIEPKLKKLTEPYGSL
jgi:hypothetical protein